MGYSVPETKTRPLSTHDDPLDGCYDLFNSVVIYSFLNHRAICCGLPAWKKQPRGLNSAISLPESIKSPLEKVLEVAYLLPP